jgi:hypothetical protein
VTLSLPSPEALLTWSPWRPLRGVWLAASTPALPGLYRIRRANRTDLDYLGQTGAGTMTLKKRLGMLRGVYAAQMPYRDPHTAGPALWALAHATGAEFEASVCPVAGATPWRKGLEALAIALYRQQHGRSPTVSFGRMPGGYRMSSGYSTRLSTAGRLFRGGPSPQADASHLTSISPTGPLDGDPLSSTWCGHTWSPWSTLLSARQQISPRATGLYRIRRAGADELTYIGQGMVASRLLAHALKAGDATNRQASAFANAASLEASYTLNSSWYTHQLLELENDLIAAHVLARHAIPTAQFLG